MLEASAIIFAAARAQLGGDRQWLQRSVAKVGHPGIVVGRGTAHKKRPGLRWPEVARMATSATQIRKQSLRALEYAWLD